MQDDDFHDEIEKTAAAEKAGANVLATAKADTPPPGHKLVDPFAHYAAIEGGNALFNGDYAKIDQSAGGYAGRRRSRSARPNPSWPTCTRRGMVTSSSPRVTAKASSTAPR